MFHKLRNKFIWFNVGITSVVIIIVFSAIYFSAAHSADHRPPIEEHSLASYPNDIEVIIKQTIKEERNSASQELLTILIVSGLAIEACVILISYFLAEIAIRPVKDAYESQKIFIANASHEIKTPLAAISANLEAADLSDNKWIKNVEDETKKITELNSSLLNLARVDLMSTKKETTKENLNKIIEKELKAIAPRIDMSNKQITLKKNLNTRIENINKKDFCEILNILLDNAIKYCDTEIVVSMEQSKIVVKNDGKLIPNDKLPHIFDRFYQVDKSAEGVGLGLSIAAAISERNGWKISAHTDKNMNIFTLTI